MSRGLIFQKLCVASEDIIQLHPLCFAFYAFEYLLFYNHRNHESDVTVIPSTMGTHQGDLLGRALFVLTQFKALHSTTKHFPFCPFPSIANDIHIIGPPSIISFAYEHF